LPIGRFLKSKSLGGNRVILAVLPRRKESLMTIRAFLLALSLLPCFTLTIQADCVQKVKHFSEAEIPEVERSLNSRVIKISAKQAELIVAEMSVRDPESKNELFSSFRALQIAQRESVSCNVLTELMDSPVICHEFRNETDVLVRFQANLRLAATGNKDAADQLCKLFGDHSLTTFDARLIRTACLQTGINADETTSEELLNHLKSLTRSSGFKTGELIADFEVVDTEGKTFKLSEHKGKIVLLHFWATNCGPCMVQMPEVKKRIGGFPAERIEVLFVSLDYDADAFAKAKGELDIKCRHIFDGRSVGGSIPKHFKVDRMPLDIVIDSAGRFVANSLDSIESLLSAEEEGRTKR
jgi:thiol-disulfide isomerase/thioredoxin